MDASVRIQQVSKHYGKKMVLEDINMEIEKGQIYGFIGPSGAGKTTIVKLIVGMDKASKGEVSVLGKTMPNLHVLQNIGYMAQSDALYTTLTAKENLQFFASLFQLSKKEQTERIAYAASIVNLTDELSKKVSAFSGGMKRRLSLAIALIQNPDLLILDEPTVGIDPELRKSVWEELLRLKEEEGKTIIVTTHVMDEAGKCDQLAMVREGRIIASGSPQQLQEQYGVTSLEEVFLQAGGAKQ